MSEAVCSARKDEVLERTASPFKPCQQACPCGFEQLKLHWPAGLLLEYGSPLSDAASAHKLSDAQLHQITATQFAVDRKVEHGAISETMLLL
jgi:hypothetical protein